MLPRHCERIQARLQRPRLYGNNDRWWFQRSCSPHTETCEKLRRVRYLSFTLFQSWKLSWSYTTLIFFSSPWTQLEYDIGTYTKFKIEISFFKGVNESEMSIFGLDNIKVSLSRNQSSWLKEIRHGFTWGAVQKQRNYTILLLPTLFTSVDCVMKDRINDSCQKFVVKFYQ